ncbi:MAG: efflux RND transporter periplasmic adaptor subunit [Alphaproteobacteria bacterium]|nr:efflux RND transporter periplasmic adaptor subunit [Alphaproteobacteria bacterium]
MLNLPRAPYRSVAIVAAAVLAIIAVTRQSIAGPGHDHGQSSPVVAGPASPRLIAISETYELVGILQNGKLVIYLDRMADTSPVKHARIELVIGGQTLFPEVRPEGTFELSSPFFEQEGIHEIIITIAEGSNSDLLIGKLDIPKDDHDHFDHDHADHHPEMGGEIGSRVPSPIAKGFELIGVSNSAIERKLQNAPLVAGFALAFGVLAGALVRGRAGLTIGLIGLVAMLGAGAAWAGPGHDHGEGGNTASNGESPRRLPDGELFLPKSTQRLLAIRTRVLRPETARSADRLIGRVIADPNRSGLVQSTIGGRVRPGETGLPVLGRAVQAGEILAYVEPAFSPIDASDVRQTAGDLEQRIAVLDARIARQRQLVAKQIASRANLQDLEIEREGLVARREQLKKSRIEPEILLAPVDGVIASVSIAAGQVVSAGETLINIVDPQSLWVEAISFDPRVDPSASEARARTSEGEFFDLTFVGRSRTLQQQASVLQFKVDQPAEALNIGSPVKVLIEKGDAITGLVVPKSAIAQAPNGQMVAFKRLEPERYLPAAVRVHDLDGERVHITSGLKAGDQIIIEGAPLVNQIR